MACFRRAKSFWVYNIITARPHLDIPYTTLTMCSITGKHVTRAYLRLDTRLDHAHSQPKK